MGSKLQQKRDYWAQHVNTWSDSGLSQQAYCLKHELTPHQFSYWKQKFNTKKDTANPPLLETVSAAFVAVDVAPQADSLGLSIELHSGIRITGVNTQTVPAAAQLIRALS